MNARAMGLLFFLVSAGCGPASPPCSASTCSGCCDASGACQPGFLREACGVGGAACDACTLSETCTLGACLPGATGGGPAQSSSGGGAGGGGGGGFNPGGGGGGSTGSRCAGSTTWCEGQCVDPDTDESHCGSCGRACGAGLVCNRGACEALPTDCLARPCPGDFGCNPQTRACDTQCFSDADCRGGAKCQGGRCDCLGSATACGTTCATGGVYASCQCAEGYEGQGHCVDVDECARQLSTCGANEVCVNTVGDFTCDCKPGYRRDGYGSTCVVDQCAVNHGGCSPNATCDQYGTEVYCSCNAGYDGDGRRCDPVCDPARGTCANAALACYPSSSYSGTCEPPGSGPAGAACATNSDCQPGTRCERTPGAVTGFCAQLCTAAGCAATKVCSVPDSVAVCLVATNQPCEPLFQDCASHYGCYPTTTGNQCASPGSQTPGQSCSYANDCAPGSACLGSTCLQLCNLSAPVCASGACQPVSGSTFGVCD